MLVENEKLYFCTARGKDFYHQIQNKPEVAITGMNKEYQMVRLNGKEPIYREMISMNQKVKPKGFIISENCIQCGLCQRQCPQQCIQDYKIKQQHCLHCGLCYENCPVNAIERRKV